MFIDVDRYVNFIIKNKLTQSQFLYLYLIYRKKYNSIKAYKKAFPTEDGTMIGKNLIQDLIDRSFIEKIKEEVVLVTDYRITEKFTHLYFSDIYNATEELKNEYPAFANIQGNNIPLITVDIYKLSGIYGERIDFSVDEHKEVIKDLIYARDKGSIRFSLENFVRGEVWKGIRPSRLANTTVSLLEFE